MQRTKVESSLIVSVGYDAQEESLEVELANGRIYRYDEVDEEIYRQLMDAESHGQYFNAYIRDGYPHARLR